MIRTVGNKKYRVNIETTGDCKYKITCTDITRSLKYDIICIICGLAELACAITWFMTGMDKESYIVFPVLLFAGLAALSIYLSTNPEPFNKSVMCSGTESARGDMLEKNIDEALSLTHKDAYEREIKELEQKKYDKQLRESLKTLKK